MIIARGGAVSGRRHLGNTQAEHTTDVQAAPGPTPIKTAATPVCMSSRVALKVTVLPTITGTFIEAQNFAISSVLYSVEMCRTVETVDWTTKTSTPASWAMAPKRSAFCGIELTEQTTPARFISCTRRAIRSRGLLLIELLDQGGRLLLVLRDHLGQDLIGVLVASLDPFEVEHSKPPSLPMAIAILTSTTPSIALARMGILRVIGLVPPRNSERDVDLIRINGDVSRHQRDLIEAIGHAGLPVPSNPHSHFRLSIFLVR